MEVSIFINVSSLMWTVLLMVFLRHGSTIEVTDIVDSKNKTCQNIQLKLGLAAQQFTYCSIVNARPITFCEECVTSFLDVVEAHQNILTGLKNGTNCRSELINVDRLEIIETLFNNIDSLWSRGNCNYCFEVNTNGTITPNLNNNTKTFQVMNSVVRKCVKDNMPKDKPDICVICRDPYEKLNEFYNSLKKFESTSGICMDIIDSMNASRMEWSKDLGCRDRQSMDLPFIFTASIVSLVPAIFYGALRKFSTRIEHRTQQ